MTILRKTMIVSAAAVLAAGLSTAVSAAELRMSSQWTENTAGAKVDKWWASEIEKRTKGEVKIKIFWAGVLGKAKENLGLIQQGAIELAAMSPGYFPAELPFHAAPNSIPMAMSRVDQATALMERLLTEVPEFDMEAKRNGMKALFMHHLNPYQLVCKDHIKSLADMKGKKVRTWGKDMPRMVQAAGGVPVTLGLAQLYEGLSRGTVDCIPFSVDLMVNYKIYEVAKNIHDITLWEGPTNAVWIGRKIWDAMSPANQKIVQQVSFEAAKRDRDAVVAAGKEAIGTLKGKGVNFRKFPAADKVAWKAANPDFFGDFIKGQDAKGRGDAAKKTIMIWREVVK
ncbi:MAG: TRAP transporter substrate-binding protein DctP [Rhodospirillaceae bacterium]|jgi:TRAP-type C4-dicarboxylate transport system substrate-binding protein|nr:TRAP transporter substrate-binding protein DctP [Rhodospirillaceae bacterium]MBT5514332.1 TRAP transporter substrate-binding protein DctP [Rhodospirillaceae bacterium]MBT6085157.1 TRAP transporter substrate-binding protein DctP [Rhodospirillaceae bacterium]MBT6607951.1 TRAP transporter substrate-binding protein DctP [Rhodospirillaceae bacterium]MBT6882760.1 TRAP transporter substrate-binding protein DctP [Rhodospirillaceae bacterium]